MTSQKGSVNRTLKTEAAFLCCPRGNCRLRIRLHAVRISREEAQALVEEQNLPQGETLKAIEKRTILKTIEDAANSADAAKILGIGRTTLFRRLERYGVSIPQKENGRRRINLLIDPSSVSKQS